MTTQELSPRSFRNRVLFLAGFAVSIACGTAAVRPQPQPLEYHRFADDRTMAGVPNMLNVASNVPFAIVGAIGLRWLWDCGRAVLQPAEMWCYGTMFVGLILTAFGSAYYHAEPNNDTLPWDRAPLTVAFMGLSAGLIAERISVRAAGALLGPLVLAGVASVVYWHVGEQRGQGDLRPYLLVQFLPLLCIPPLLLMFPPRYLAAAGIFQGLCWYVLAKILEQTDRTIFDLNGAVSGHTLKHLAAAMGAYWLLRTLRAGFARPTDDAGHPG